MKKPQRDDLWNCTPDGVIIPRRAVLPTRRFIQKWGQMQCCCDTEGGCTNSPCGSPLYLTGSGFSSNGSCTGCTFCTSVLNNLYYLTTLNWINYSTETFVLGCGAGNPNATTTTTLCLKVNDAETTWWWEAIVVEGLAGDPTNTQTGIFRSATMSSAPASKDCVDMAVTLSLYDIVVAGTGGCCDFSSASLVLTSSAP